MTFGFGFGFPRMQGVAAAFSPAILFASGEVGAWYDPSDLTTMFQDTAGTTPVTTPSQTVALLLDKSRVQSFDGPKRNLLTFSEDLTNVVWVKASVTIPATQYLAPDGTTSAELMYPTSSGTNRFVYQTLTSPSGIYTASVYAKASGKSFFVLDISGGSAAAWFNLSSGTIGTVSAGYAASIQSVGDGWYRCSIRNTSNLLLSFSGVYGVTDADNTRTVTANGTDGILIWGTQFETGSTAKTYQRINAGPLPAAWIGNHATQATAASRPTYQIDGGGRPYLGFDGVDDGLATGSIDFTATDKMTVFAGGRRLADTAGVIAELSSNWNSNNGSFLFWGGSNIGGTGNGFNSSSRGSSVASPDQFGFSPATFTPPVTAVVTVIHDIPGDLSAVRGNTVAGANGTGDKGTGNFGNYPLFVGRRGGTSLPYNGNIYGLIVRGAATDAANITSTETWLNGKTGAY